MHEIVNAGFHSANLSFIRDITIDELIAFIVENVDVYTESMQAAAMFETGAVAGIYRGTGWHVWFCRKNHYGTIH